jgi:hypothetical protein
VGVCRKKREANNYSRLKMREPLVCSLSFSYSIAFICSIYCKDCVDLTEKYVSKEIEMKRSDEKPAYTSKHAISLLILVKLFVSTVTGNSKIA